MGNNRSTSGHRKCFTMKTFGADKYTWCPETFQKKITTTLQDSGVPSFCTAVAGSQGQDFVTTYCYGVDHSAYVECDYVE